jgi:hypothetical protein
MTRPFTLGANLLEQFKEGYRPPKPPPSPPPPAPLDNINTVHIARFGKKAPNRKHNLGSNPCSFCSSRGHHELCRPRLDGKPCSCSCERATRVRELYELACDEARYQGKPFPTVEQAAEGATDDNVKDLIPRTYKKQAATIVKGIQIENVSRY